MRLPLSWLLEYAPLAQADAADPAEVARRLTGAGLEVESVEPVGHDASGIVVAEVTEIEELDGFRKPVRYCAVRAGEAETSHVICGAVNFTVGDRVPLAAPGSVLPGGREIGAKTAYGRLSEGMICSAAELGIGDDHSGILVLASDAPLGADFAIYAGLRDVVLDINVTPDRGYALSVRGVARELAIAFGAEFRDPADAGLAADAGLLAERGRVADLGVVSGDVYPASIDDPTACDRFVLREVRGFDASRPTPLPMLVRMARAGIRTVSLAVDITNYLMLEIGQPLHAFDKAKLCGPIVVRRARPGERLETLDHVVRELDPEDILITDSSGPISMAGTMGGLATEVTPDSRDLVIEAAHFSARGTARMSRRHRLYSDSSARFERGVDRELPLRATARAAQLLVELGGGTAVPGCTHASVEVTPVSIVMAAGYPDRVAGMDYGPDTVRRRLRQVGCEVRDQPAGESLVVLPPSWRPDLADPSDLAEEVIRLEGYENIPVRMPRATAGRGLTRPQRLRRAVGGALADVGYVEVLSSPFSPVADADAMMLPAADPRRLAPRLANPVSAEEPLLRSSLLPGLLRVLVRNVGRGFADVALFEVGTVFRSRPGGQPVAPILPVDHKPTAAELAELDAALPEQPLHLAAVLSGDRELAGWWGAGRPAAWDDAVDAVRRVLGVSQCRFAVRASRYQPWHPGRCAAVYLDLGEGRKLAGHAGELHPRAVQAFGLPPRTCAVELDLSLIEAAAAAAGPVQAPSLSPYPVATQDVALTVPDTVPAADVEAALIAGAASAGENLRLEDVRLFDVYTGEQAGQGRKSLAYRLRFRAPDRTLTAEEVAVARDAAVAEASRRTGAELRSG
jgi:phenylalanyl-tRNA synthetase beta chain